MDPTAQQPIESLAAERASCSFPTDQMAQVFIHWPKETLELQAQACRIIERDPLLCTPVPAYELSYAEQKERTMQQIVRLVQLSRVLPPKLRFFVTSAMAYATLPHLAAIDRMSLRARSPSRAPCVRLTHPHTVHNMAQRVSRDVSWRLVVIMQQIRSRVLDAHRSA